MRTWPCEAGAAGSLGPLRGVASICYVYGLMEKEQTRAQAGGVFGSGRPRPRSPRQTPYKRTYPSGRVVWVARYLDREGRANYAKPAWNRRKSSFKLRRDAQRAIDEALSDLAASAPPS